MTRASFEILDERRRVWTSKPIIRKLYKKWYSHIQEALRPGRTLELGGGSGNLREFLPEAITSDIVFAPWLDAVMDAQALAFKKESLDNIVLFDVLHHLSAPALFFQEVQKVLRPGGRAVLMEPYVSPLSFPVYRFVHAEGMRWDADPFRTKAMKNKEPFEGNQALPTLIFERHREQFNKRFPHLEILQEDKMDFFLYPLSGGFHNPCLCPRVLWRPLEFLEGVLRPFKSLLAFRLFIVLEKR